MLKKGMKVLNQFWHGNNLNGRPNPPEPRPTTAKRANDIPPTKPPKRQRTEDDVNHDVYSVPSSSDMTEQPYATTAPYKKGPHGSQSLRSSSDRYADGRGVGELRSTNRKTGFGTKRSRHKNPARRPSIGSIGDGLENTPKTTPPNAFKPKRSLHYIREQPSDPIQIDDVTFVKESRTSGTKGRADPRLPRNNQYTASSFEIDGGFSEDELSAPQSRAQPAEQTRNVSETQAKNRRKRAAELGDDVRQPGPSTKRRLDNSSRADMHRTRFSSRATHTEGNRVGLRISRAVCGPSYAFPAEGTMRDNMPGASNKSCLLVPAINQPSCFKAVDEKTGEVVTELEWLTPNIAKIQSITSNQNSGVVLIKKAQDFVPRLQTGTLMLVEFKSCEEAKRYIKLCCASNDGINTGTSRTM